MACRDERAADERIAGVTQPGQPGEHDAGEVRRGAVTGEPGRQDQGTAAKHGGRGGGGPPGARPPLAGGPGQQAREHRRAAQGDHGGHGHAGTRHGRVEGDRVPGHGQRAEAEQPPLSASAGSRQRARATAGEEQQQAPGGQAGRTDGGRPRPGWCQGAGGTGSAPQHRRGEDGRRPGQQAGLTAARPVSYRARGTCGMRRRRGAGERLGGRGCPGRSVIRHCRELRDPIRGTGLESGARHNQRLANGQGPWVRSQRACARQAHGGGRTTCQCEFTRRW